MAGKKKDGVADGWILYKAWCERNGGTPIRGGSSAEHICFIGPLPEDTIDPGDEGTVDIATPEGDDTHAFDQERLALGMLEAKLELDKAELQYKTKVARINQAMSAAKSK